jgi:hypothetical protein
VLYREYPLPHAVEPGFLAELAPWIASALYEGLAEPRSSPGRDARS